MDHKNCCIKRKKIIKYNRHFALLKANLHIGTWLVTKKFHIIIHVTVHLDNTLKIALFKRSQYAGAYSFGFFIDVFGDSLLLSHLL